MGNVLFGDDFITLKYIKRYPNSARTKQWKGRIVMIESDHGLWRPDAKGYTDKYSTSWVVLFEKAVKHTYHCGPEKRVKYIDANSKRVCQ